MNYFKEKTDFLEVVFRFKREDLLYQFLKDVDELSDKMNHHANYERSSYQVKMQLTTHDAGNTLTRKDYDLAIKIEELYEKIALK